MQEKEITDYLNESIEEKAFKDLFSECKSKKKNPKIV